MKHKLTKEERQKGGWARARQKAEERRAHPTELEAAIRGACDRLGYVYYPEYEIWNEFGPYPQWFDIFILSCNCAIEVDGSHAWHDRRYPSSKMYDYDQAKRLYCDYHHIHLVVIHEWFYEDAELAAIVQSEIVVESNPVLMQSK